MNPYRLSTNEKPPSEFLLQVQIDHPATYVDPVGYEPGPVVHEREGAVERVLDTEAQRGSTEPSRIAQPAVAHLGVHRGIGAGVPALVRIGHEIVVDGTDGGEGLHNTMARGVVRAPGREVIPVFPTEAQVDRPFAGAVLAVGKNHWRLRGQCLRLKLEGAHRIQLHAQTAQ